MEVLSNRACRLALLVFFVILPELMMTSPVTSPELNAENEVLPDDVHDELTLEEKKEVVRALQKMEKNVAKQHNKPLDGDLEESNGFLFEGDIALRPSEAVAMAEMTSRRQKRKMTATEDKRWTLPIPYRFEDKTDAALGKTEIDHIRIAIAQWESLTCITFKEVDANHTVEPILLFKRDKGCWSYVGKEKAFKEQEVSIGIGCSHVGTIVHEIGHAIGFWHEHSRPDRNDHIIIRYENVKYGKDYNFYKEPWRIVNPLGVPYDEGSIMHYGSSDFSHDDQSQTIQTVDPLVQRVLGQRSRLSFYDVKLANLAYCSKKCPKLLTDNQCLHEGYTDPLSCSKCRCPDGLKGSKCQLVDDPVGAPCGGTIHIEGSETYTIQTPGYPTSFLPNQRCHWLIKAKQGKRVVLNVSQKHFLFTQNCSSSPLSTCADDYLEVKYHVSFGATGARFCCALAPNSTIESHGSDMLVIFRSSYGGIGGFQATVSSESCGGCSSSEPENQRACLRLVQRSCPQTWTVREKVDCPVFFLPTDSDCGGYRKKNMTRNSTCLEEEAYCCAGLEVVDGKCQGVQQSNSSSGNIVSYRDDVPDLNEQNFVPVKSPITRVTTTVTSTANQITDVDGWSPWRNVSVCSQVCGGCGQRTLKRTCEHPERCGGKTEETRSERCNTQPCTQSFVTLCSQKKKVEYRCGLFWSLKMCTRYQMVLTVCKSFCCQGHKNINGTCTPTSGT